ncbi:TonB-dependent receptor [Salisaeta longa]|uniref:TonB-dependent receptor n=1 Tax=Salisaeta longa TaxID=503170 RepID=UPI000417B4DE|nr:TonB-dependent receptor [Salisaeta longa]
MRIVWLAVFGMVWGLGPVAAQPVPADTLVLSPRYTMPRGLAHVAAPSRYGLAPDRSLRLRMGRRGLPTPLLLHTAPGRWLGAQPLDASWTPPLARASTYAVAPHNALRYGTDVLGGVVRTRWPNTPLPLTTTLRAGRTGPARVPSDGAHYAAALARGWRLPNDGFLNAYAHGQHRAVTQRAVQPSHGWWGQRAVRQAGAWVDGAWPLADGPTLYATGGLRWKATDTPRFRWTPRPDEARAVQPWSQTDVYSGAVVAGVRGPWTPTWRYDLSLAAQHHTVHLRSTATAALPLGTPVRPDVGVGARIARLGALRATLSGTVDVGFVRPLAVHAGARVSHETLTQQAGAPAGTQVAGLQPLDPALAPDGRRTRVDATVDVAIPLAARLTLDFGGRFAFASDSSATLNGLTGLRLSASPRLRFFLIGRMGLRLPTLMQRYATTTLDTWVLPLRTTGDQNLAQPPRTVARVTHVASAQLARSGDANRLREETTLLAALGGQYRGSSLRLSGRLFYQLIRDRITLSRALPDRLFRQSAQSAPYIRHFDNAFDLAVPGVQARAAYRRPLGAHRQLVVQAAALYTAPRVLKTVTREPGFGRATRRALVDAQPRALTGAALTYATARWRWGVRVQHAGAFHWRGVRPAHDVRFAPETRVALHVRRSMWGNRLRVGLRVNNLLDQYPTAWPAPYQGDDVARYPRAAPYGFAGRSVALSVTYRP